MLKFCGKCNKETEHYKCGGCKPCTLARTAKYRKENPEKDRARKAKYRATKIDAEKERSRKAKFLAENIDKERERKRRYSAENRKKERERYAKYRSANPEKIRTHVINRRARKKMVGGKLSFNIVERMFRLQKGKCVCCGQLLGSDFHIDHIMPLALGGPNTDENIQLLRSECNLQKNAKHPIDFMQKRGFLL